MFDFPHPSVLLKNKLAMSNFTRVCWEIFNICVCNTKGAERANRQAAQLDTHGSDGSDEDAVSGPGTPTSGTSSTHMKTDADVEASAKAVWV
jgi:hypothetical protein